MLARNTKKLPDSFRKTEDSNNNKMLLLQEQALDDFVKDMVQLEDSLDIWKAQGETLNLYGESVGQKRGNLDDDKYRYVILSRISANMTQADTHSVIANIVQMFNLAGDNIAEDIVIEEGDEPCTLRLVKLPMDTLATAGFSSVQAVEMIRTVLPVGISIVADNFEGTFEFSDTDNDYDENAGFADDTQTMGGYFGLLLGEDTTSTLPI